MAKKQSIELVTVNLSGRGIADIGRIIRERMQELFGNADFEQLDLGFKLPEKFLCLDGPRPTLAQLTVLARILKLRIRITHMEFEDGIADKSQS